MAGGGSNSPRQKMINLMYLVFISMLAMNVDREVLRSFESVNESLELSTQLTDQNNMTFYQQISDKKSKGEDGYAEIFQEAMAVKKHADDAYNQIQSIKLTLIKNAEYKISSEVNDDDKETDYNSLQNTDAVNQTFFLTENKPKADVQKMFNQINNFSNFLIQGSQDKKSKARVQAIFDFKDKKGKTWLVNQFYDQPMIAALTNLTRLQSSIRTEEGNRVRDLLSTKLQDDIELKAFQPIVSAPKYAKVGEKVDVVIGFGAYDSTLKGLINMNGQNVPLVDGRGIVSFVASGVGKKTISGTITYNTPSGPKTEPFSQEYEVVSETLKEVPNGASVVADKMNVVYRGVINPMSGSVTGVDASTVRLTASSGSLTKSGTGWNYIPGSGKTTTFTISGITSTGKKVSKSYTYRIKNVPKAQGQIRGQNVLSIPASSIQNQTVSASIPDFEFPVTFNVTGFKVKVPGAATLQVSGNSLRGASGVLSRVRAGDQVLIFDIAASSTGVKQSNISPIVINVK